jgi:DNA-directed RNA polymerase subunit N (RpoN/RPB10)
MYEEFKQRVANGEDKSKVMNELGVDKMCCRSVFLGQEDLVELVGRFKKA